MGTVLLIRDRLPGKGTVLMAGLLGLHPMRQMKRPPGSPYLGRIVPGFSEHNIVHNIDSIILPPAQNRNQALMLRDPIKGNEEIGFTTGN
jgi:hypothetical protein